MNGKNFISIRHVEGAWATDFLSQQHLANHVVWVFPPKVIALVTFQTLLRIARKNFWCLIILDYETLSPIWSEVSHNKNFEIIEEIKNDPVLFPAKHKGPHGYWKVPKKAKISAIIHRPESFKRKLVH